MEAETRSDATRMALDQLVRTMRLHHKVVEKRIDGYSLHHGQHRMLMKLSCMGRTASQKDIALALDVSPACVARTLKALNAAGLIDKAEGADGRCREIALLPAGEKLVEDTVKTFRAIDAEMFEGVSDDEVARLIDTLGKIHQNLCKMENPEGVSCP